jgi:hypothetical protein
LQLEASGSTCIRIPSRASELLYSIVLRCLFREVDITPARAGLVDGCARESFGLDSLWMSIPLSSHFYRGRVAVLHSLSLS